VIVPREAPLSEIHLENMLRLCKWGASILPPVPAWYNAPKTIDDVENFIVGKVLDLFKIKHTLYKRWEG
jgi:flavin prenyltransferase